MLLKIENIHKHFGGVSALANVSLSVAKGTVLGIVGDNGAGKSTLMKCISGAMTPEDGNIVFDEKPLALGQPSTIRDVGIEMIYQDLGLCLAQDVLFNIFLGRELRTRFGFLDHVQMQKDATAIFKKLKTMIPSNKEVGLLSGGQQQTVALARAMISHPKLIIMDEPTSALSAKEVQIVLDFIRGLKQDGVTVLMISHRLNDIFEVADRICIMKQGRIVQNTSTNKTSMKEVISKIVGENEKGF